VTVAPAFDVAFDVGLALLVLAVAGWTIAARETFASVVGFVAYGLLLALVWVRLAAVDVALTEAAIGGGLTGGLLVGAATRLRRTEAAAAAEQPSVMLRIAAGVLSILVSGGLAAVVLLLPDPAPTLAPLAVANMAATGLGNPVTAVLMAYRAFDTLLEAVVLLLALIGIWSLAPDRFWSGYPGLQQRADPDGVLAFLARLLPPLGILVGIYIFWIGSVAPGGEFQGATILAAMWLLVMIAGLTHAPPVTHRRLRLMLVVGPAVFFAVGLAGFAMAGAFLAYPPHYAKLWILIIEMPLTLSIAAALALLVAGPPNRVRPR
jgi:multisubunit Na+/H+ antiporter MnhB subunit